MSTMTNQTTGLHGALRHWATTRPSAPFIVAIEPARTFSYAAALGAVRDFQRRLGPEPRTILAMLPPGDAMAILWLAALTGGHEFVPLSTEATDEEQARMVARYSPDIFVREGAEETAAPESPGPGQMRLLTRGMLEQDLARWAGRDDAGDAVREWEPRAGTLHLMTSGTTGSPKGVRLTAAQIAWAADHIRVHHGLTPEDRGLSVLPFFHVNAPVVSLCASLMAGAAVAIAPRFSKRRFWSWIEREGIIWASVVPTIVAILLDTERPDWLPGTLRFARSASAPLPAAQLVAFEQRFGVPLVETYGLTEAASTVAANPVPPGIHKPGSVGLPLGVEICVRAPRQPDQSATSRDLPPGEEGEICLAGPSVITEYEGGEDAESFEDGWFRTGDLGHIDADGYLSITGRSRDMIVRGGNNIAPREIEEVLLEHPGVREVAVVGRPDPMQGEQPEAYVVPKHPAADLEAELAAFAAQRLSRYKVPAAFHTVEALPHAANGKIQRSQIGEEMNETPQGNA
jgi:acyl-CoA synthetase (AMP-forming)/AMP-acid ligase II